MQKCIATYFQANNVNQVMLFERADRLGHAQSLEPTGLNSTLPSFLTDLLSTLSTSLRPVLPSKTHALLFPSPSGTAFARQVIINHYLPGEGITPHVDLLDRFGDGIIGVSMGSGCVMRFRKVEYDDDLDLDDDHHGDAQKQKEWDVYLPSGSVYVMTEEARYEWTHEIEKRMEDWVEAGLDPDDTSSEGGSAGVGKRIPRSVRVSITFRWLLPGADVVGTSDA
ncbi:hypothetical protein EUX98_g4796 [Antrodiella citrinella]|uniref:Fe2OG dioxygenase domain-containing protein n=1 Tax=Antrodiella citrinella TaxID=2447956 RepID=A0A4V3XIJ7_9APHY|nr:hypothetical protein EUX98_g4796 [Antrodiella citrinella]